MVDVPISKVCYKYSFCKKHKVKYLASEACPYCKNKQLKIDELI